MIKIIIIIITKIITKIIIVVEVVFLCERRFAKVVIFSKI